MDLVLLTLQLLSHQPNNLWLGIIDYMEIFCVCEPYKAA